MLAQHTQCKIAHIRLLVLSCPVLTRLVLLSLGCSTGGGTELPLRQSDVIMMDRFKMNQVSAVHGAFLLSLFSEFIH